MAENQNIQTNILGSIKSLLGIANDDTDFDDELLIHINSNIASLVQMGIGPSEGFEVTSNSSWSDFVGNDKRLNSIKSYIYMKVKLIFDPPVNSSTVEAYKTQVAEFEWRNRVTKEIDDNESVE